MASSSCTQYPAAAQGLWRIYTASGLTAIGNNLLFVGIFFFTKYQFGWTPRQNFLLAGGQGLFYIVGALSAHPLTRKMDRRTGLIVLSAPMSLATVAAAMFPNAVVVTAVVLFYTVVNSTGWPIFESLVSDGADPRRLSRRIGAYNLSWAPVGVAVIAIEGTLINIWPPLVFALPAAAHVVALALLWNDRRRRPLRVAAAPVVPPQAEAALLDKRELALWLSRIALPTTFCLIYSLGAIMPSLRLIGELPKAGQTAVASVWMAGRVLAFMLLITTTWWHTRPRLLLGASVIMVIAFLGICVRWSDLAAGIGLGRHSLAADIVWICSWELVLGMVMGLIYSASLYFGMVLSEGSTEHGGYHEALIGLGQVIGPAVGVSTMYFWPGNLPKSVAAISALLAASVVLSVFAGFKRNHLRAKSGDDGPVGGGKIAG